MYKSMICDIKNSKDLINREEIQSYLINAIKLCNEKYSKFIAAPFQITAGDEWEGLLYLNAPIEELIDGPAFHLGRMALKYAKKKDLSLVTIRK